MLLNCRNVFRAAMRTVDLNCERCGERFTRPFKRRDRRFCGYSCAAKDRPRVMRGPSPTANAKTCAVCGGSFRCPPSTNSVTCSQACSRTRKSEIQRGERSHRWRGGRTDAAKVLRGSSAYDRWRTAVFVRDDFRCALCPRRGRRMTAHHIEPFAVAPDRRLDVANGITMCWDCHRSIRRREHEYAAAFVSILAVRARWPLCAMAA